MWCFLKTQMRWNVPCSHSFSQRCIFDLMLEEEFVSLLFKVIIRGWKCEVMECASAGFSRTTELRRIHVDTNFFIFVFIHKMMQFWIRIENFSIKIFWCRFDLERQHLKHLTMQIFLQIDYSKSFQEIIIENFLFAFSREFQ